MVAKPGGTCTPLLPRLAHHLAERGVLAADLGDVAPADIFEPQHMGAICRHDDLLEFQISVLHRRPFELELRLTDPTRSSQSSISRVIRKRRRTVSRALLPTGCHSAAVYQCTRYNRHDGDWSR